MLTIYKSIDGSYLKIEPNPINIDGHTIVNYSTGKIENVILQVFDLTGKMVSSLPIEGKQINNQVIFTPRVFSAGIYTIKITGSKSVLTGKLIIR